MEQLTCNDPVTYYNDPVTYYRKVQLKFHQLPVVHQGIMNEIYEREKRHYPTLFSPINRTVEEWWDNLQAIDKTWYYTREICKDHRATRSLQ